jgi:hypothetical protein
MPYVLYRAIKGKGARVSDFWSAFALGEEPFPIQVRQPLEWAGVSTFNDLGKAMTMAALWRQGRFLAELHIPDDPANVIVSQTGRKNPFHYSVMATPHTLLSFVAQVLPITEQSTY